jgi:peptidyl-prolyl cis-trans isomerase C
MNNACKLVFVLVTGASGLFAASALGQVQVTDSRPAAIVNGEPMSVAEVAAVIKLLPAPKEKATTPAASEQQQKTLRHEALEMLIDDVLMRQFLAKNGRRVDSGEVDKRLAELDAALKAQKRTLQDFLNDTAQTEAHLRLDVIKKIQWDDFMARQITEPNLRRYYDENKDFYDQSTVRASHIWLRVAPTAGANDCERARATLLDLRQRIINGQIDFAEAAKRYSQCESAAHGGDIGYFPRKWAVDEKIARAAFALRVGEVSDVVQSDYGFHLIKVTDRKVGQPSEYTRVRDEVRENYAMELWHSLLLTQRRQAQIQTYLP